MKFHQETLDNGLTIVGEQREHAACCAIGFFVRTGSRDETPEVSGVSHFLEHMLFKGTDKRNALELTYELGSIGAQSNAYTNEENTVYYVYVLPEYFAQAFDILSDMMRPALDVNEFNTEKNVILEEIALYEDRPMFKLYEAAMEQYFKGHTAGNSVLGTNASITALSRDQMKAYYDKRYAPNNMTLAVSGAFDWEEVVGLAKKHCGAWPSMEVERQYPEHKPVESEKVIKKDDLQMAHVCFVGEGPSATDENRYAGYLLACLLGDGTGSRAYWELIDTGLADGASVEIDEMDRAGAFYACVSGLPEKIDELSGIMANILKTPMEFDDEALERVKTKIRTRLVLSGESSPRRLMSIGNEWNYRRSYSTLDQELARLNAVSRKDIEDFLSNYPLKPFTKVSMLPS